MNPTLKNWLREKKATVTEARIFLFAVRVCRGNKACFMNGDILKLHGSSRTNIRQYLTRMIEKGLIKKNTFHTYIPVLPDDETAKRPAAKRAQKKRG